MYLQTVFPAISTVVKNKNITALGCLSCISLHAMSSDKFLSIDSQILYLIVPNKIQVALSIFQRAFQEHQRIKMENKALLEKLLNESFRKEYLLATNMTNYKIVNGVAFIRPGEHIAVYDGSVYHHGIYMGIKNKCALVLDNCAEKELMENRFNTVN